MSTIQAIAVLIVALVCWEAFVWALKSGVFSLGLFRLTIAARKPLPVGSYRWELPNSIAVGKPDTVVVFKMPLQPSTGDRKATHVAVSDSATQFGVGDRLVDVDGFLEAYDDELGPLEIQVHEPGKIAAIRVDAQ